MYVLVEQKDHNIVTWFEDMVSLSDVDSLIVVTDRMKEQRPPINCSDGETQSINLDLIKLVMEYIEDDWNT